MKRSILLLLIFVCSAAVFGQTYTIRGTAKDTLNNITLHQASVVAIRASDSVMASFTRVAANGNFELKVPAQGKYILSVSFPGFADYVETINVNKSETNLGNVPMYSKQHLLEEFVVKKQVSAIKIKGDTTEYMADSFKVKENATVEDLLKRLPGIQVDKNGQITAQGETVSKILVDGEEFFSDDPKVVTQGLQAAAVTKVQVFDKKSDQAEFTGIDDGQKTKTINLELKENRKRGYFGKIDAGAGNAGYYQNQGMLNAFRGKRQISAFGIMSNTDKVGLGWADNDKFGGGNATEITEDGGYIIYGGGNDDFTGWNGKYNGEGLPKIWTGGLHFADKWQEDKQHISATYRTALQQVEMDGNNVSQYSLAGDSTRINTEDKHQFSKGDRHAWDLMYEWKIDSTTTLKLSANAGTKHAENATLYHTETYFKSPADGPKTINDRSISGSSDAQFINTSLLFKKKFAKKGRTFSLDVKENYKDTKGDGHLNSTIFVPGIVTPAITDQKKVNNVNTLVFSSKAVYTEPLSKRSILEFNYALTANNSSSLNSSLDKPVGGGDYTVLRDSFSSDYQYNVLSNKGGIMYKYSYKKANVSFGSDVSHTDYLQTDMLHGDTSLKYNYSNLFPSANFTYKIAKQTSFNLSYNGNTRQPTITQIQPLSQNTDPLNITIGNPNLKQEFTNRMSVRFNDYKTLSHRYLWTSVSFSTTENAISSSQFIDGAKSTTQYVNVDGNYSANGYGGYGFKIKKIDLNMHVSVDFNTNHINNFVNNVKNVSDNNSYTLGTSFSFDKEEKYDFRLQPGITLNDNRSTISTFTNNYWVFNTELSGEIQLPKKFEINTSIDLMKRQETVVFTSNNNVVKWNAYVGKKFTKKGELEVKFSIFDILNQNVGYTRTAQGNMITQNNYNTIRRYGMLSVVWNFTHNPAMTAAKE